MPPLRKVALKVLKALRCGRPSTQRAGFCRSEERDPLLAPCIITWTLKLHFLYTEAHKDAHETVSLAFSLPLCKQSYILAIKRNEIELFVVRWMDLESVIQSEVSQKEKNKYRMLTHIYGI